VPRDSRPAPRKLPQQERSRALYDAILVAAAELLEKDGPTFTLAEVATRAGVGSGSFYQYFPDRAALIGALIDRQLTADRAKLESFARTSEDETADLPELLVAGVLDLYGARPKAMANLVILLRELGRDHDVARLTEEFCAAVATRLERAHPDAGRTACLDAARTAVHALLGSVRQAAQDTPERLVGHAAFRSRLVAVARAALMVGTANSAPVR
jgi:AcrR family transcriptional regulator